MSVNRQTGCYSKSNSNNKSGYLLTNNEIICTPSIKVVPGISVPDASLRGGDATMPTETITPQVKVKLPNTVLPKGTKINSDDKLSVVRQKGYINKSDETSKSGCLIMNNNASLIIPTVKVVPGSSSVSPPDASWSREDAKLESTMPGETEECL